MKQLFTKISFILVLLLFFTSCNAVKHLNDGEQLLTKNTVLVNGEATKNYKILSQLYQKPNPKTLGIPIGLHIYNLADQQPDSTFQKWLHKKPKREQHLINFLSKKQVVQMNKSYTDFNKWLQKSGNAPVIIKESKIDKSIERLNKYFFSFGWFNKEITYKIDSTGNKRASITYQVTKHQPYVVDSIVEIISSAVVDSLYQKTKHQSFIQKGKQYATNDFENERDRITLQFRNSGLYNFNQDYVIFDADTVNTNHKVNIQLLIPNKKITVEDSIYTEPFKIFRINEVRIITDFSYENSNKNFQDSIFHKGFKLFSYETLKYKAKALTDAIAITPGSIYKDIDRTLTLNQLNDLGIFKYPNIKYQEDPRDSTGTGLITTILLSPKKTYFFDINLDTYTSTIQQLGVGFNSSLLIRNIFKGAETLQIGVRGSIGSSKDAADRDSRFFNISDVGGDVKLSFPRIIFPIKTEKIIPKYMSPSTNLSVGLNAQNNIGLDRQNINAAFDYKWKPSKIVSNKFELFNIQYVRNLNTNNYFNVYKNSFTQLNTIAQETELENPNSIPSDYYTINSNQELKLTIPFGTNQFINDALNGNITGISTNSTNFETIRNIDERKDRLTEDNLIFASSFSWSRDTRENYSDNSFSRLRFKLETAGNFLKTLASLANLNKNSNGNYEILGVTFSQYVKFETEYIKHWNISSKNILAIRSFGGIAIPYGNSTSIPFTRSYFAGGANDNRGWKPYDLGPGSSGSILDFNEANFKIALNAEYRFNILGSFKGALFADAGNIWNVFDDIEEKPFTFDGIKDIKEIALASGFGLRYDFGFFVFRLDIGFKTHNPARKIGERWFKDYNFSKAVYNIGINYPF